MNSAVATDVTANESGSTQLKVARPRALVAKRNRRAAADAADATLTKRRHLLGAPMERVAPAGPARYETALARSNSARATQQPNTLPLCLPRRASCRAPLLLFTPDPRQAHQNKHAAHRPAFRYFNKSLASPSAQTDSTPLLSRVVAPTAKRNDRRTTERARSLCARRSRNNIRTLGAIAGKMIAPASHSGRSFSFHCVSVVERNVKCSYIIDQQHE